MFQIILLGSDDLQLSRKKKVAIVVAGFILSIVIALVSFGFLISEHFVSELLWQKLIPAKDGRKLAIIVVGLLGGTIVGYLHKKWGALPQTAEASLNQLRTQKMVDYQPVFKSLLLAFVILVFGAGVGPEAGLLGAVVALSVWESDKLRYFYFTETPLEKLSWWAWLHRLLMPNRYLLSYDQKRSQATHKQRTKHFFDVLFIINGLITFTLLMKLSGQPSFITKMGTSHWHWQELWLIIPLVILGVLFGDAYRYFARWCQQLFSFWSQRPIAKAWLGAGAVILVALSMPNLLFSGQVSIALAPVVGMKQSFLFLITAAIAKLIYLQVCVNTGWLGGDIFPVTFASIIAGFAVAQLLPQFDHLFIVAIVSTASLITMLQKPVLASVFVALFFPINLWPIILVILLLAMGYQRIYKLRQKQPIG